MCNRHLWQVFPGFKGSFPEIYPEITGYGAIKAVFSPSEKLNHIPQIFLQKNRPQPNAIRIKKCKEQYEKHKRVE
jgi:hypothetical protein